MSEVQLGKTVELECDEKEKRIIERIRAMEYGEMRIVVRDGSPVQLEEITRGIRL